jgi:hypothetical protein
MRWKTKQPPEVGAIRERKIFTFFPVSDGETTVWLEYVTVREQYFKFARASMDSLDPDYFFVWDVIKILK